MPYINSSALTLSHWCDFGATYQTQTRNHTAKYFEQLLLRLAMELTVKGFNGITKRLIVDCNATVGELKQLILRDFNVDPSQQKLSANNGQRINLDDDARNLSSYGLHAGSTIALLISTPGPMQVFVKNEKGVTSTYDVGVNETVTQLQSKIYNKLRTPVDQQRLIYGGRQLESGSMLRDYNITSGSTIEMTLRLRGG